MEREQVEERDRGRSEHETRAAPPNRQQPASASVWPCLAITRFASTAFGACQCVIDRLTQRLISHSLRLGAGLMLARSLRYIPSPRSLPSSLSTLPFPRRFTTSPLLTMPRTEDTASFKVPTSPSFPISQACSILPSV